MEVNDVLTNNEVIETTEEVIRDNSGTFLKIGVGVGLAAVTGLLVYKYVAKPVIAKIKAKKESPDVVEVEAKEVDKNEQPQQA